MHSSPFQVFHLSPRGAGGLCCDGAGIALGAATLVRRESDDKGRSRFRPLPRQGLARVLSTAYGPQPDDIIDRCARGLNRAASAIAAGEMCLAGIETVLLALPDPHPDSLHKLAKLEKWGDSWRYQPRVPARQSGAGQWTTDDSGGGSDANLDDGVYRPGADGASVVPIAGGAEEETEPRGSNGPPPDFNTLVEAFPGLQQFPVAATILSSFDGFVGFSATTDGANAAATEVLFDHLVHQIRALVPNWRSDQLWPAGGINAMSWLARGNLIDNLRMQLAVTTYKIRGDIGPLQLETLRFLARTVDEAYDQAVSGADGSRIAPAISRQLDIGNQMDALVRRQLRQLFGQNGISFGPNQSNTIYNRDYNTSLSDPSYRIPDAKLGNVVFDWTLSPKSAATPQIVGYFRADSQPDWVIIIRPSAFGPGNVYMIRRPKTYYSEEHL